MNYLLSILTFLLSAIFISSFGGTVSMPLYIIHLFMIAIASSCLFLYQDRPYSCHKVFNLFYLFFMAIAPYVQYENRAKIWADDLSTSDYLNTSAWTLFILIAYNVLYFLFIKSGTGFLKLRKFFAQRTKPVFSLSKTILVIIISIALLAVTFWYYDCNIDELIYRNVEGATSKNAIVGQIVTFFARPFTLLMLLLILVYRPDKWIMISILGGLGILTFFPTSVPRFAMAAIYLPIAIVTIPLLRRKNVFVALMITAILVIWPAINIFRTSDGQYNMQNASELFLSGNMDTYTSLARVLKYDIVTMGSQLVAVFLFFVPRSYWPDKPLSSGAFLSEQCSLSFDNISCQYFAEGFINFGIIGILGFLLLIAWITASIDNTYWKTTQKRNAFTIFYLMSISFLFYILRGALQDSWSYLLSFSISLTIANMLLTKKKRLS